MKKILILLFALCATQADAAQNYFTQRVVSVAPQANECIGDTSDPVCIFDAVIACVIRDDEKLCESVGVKYSDEMRNALGQFAGADYRYSIAELFINRRNNLCENADDRACVNNTDTGDNVRVDLSMKDNKNVAVYLQREKDNKWSVIFATQYFCWSDEDCS